MNLLKDNFSNLQSMGWAAVVWAFVATFGLGLNGPAWAQSAPKGIDYLEALAEPGALADNMAYIAPSQISEHYSHAVYVNASARGENMQRMWVISRSGLGRDSWRLAMVDRDYWSEQDERPHYSWPVSTGRRYADSRSGPTPLGVFNIDDRDNRHRPGWGSPGMYNSMFLDLHYSSGRASGVAFHGTTRGRYSMLGNIDSHGCVRMTQENADDFFALLHPRGVDGESSPLWGEVPRYFSSTPRGNQYARSGYWRDGDLRENSNGEILTKPGYRMLVIIFRDDI